MNRAFITWVGRRAVRWIYRECALVGRDQLPATGPVLLVGNHANDLPDVIFGLATTSRPVRFIATISAGTGAISRAAYSAMGVIPVARVRDARKMKALGVDMVAMNGAAARMVAEALTAHDVVAVFPEGGVHDLPHVGRFRAGVAKMVLDTLDSGAVNDVTVVPFGVQYEAPRTPRSDVVTVIGAPTSVVAWRAQHDAAATPAALTADLHQQLCRVTRNSADWASADERDQLTAAVAAGTAPPDRPQALLAYAAATAHAAAAVVADARSDAPSAHSVRLRTMAHRLAEAVERAGGIGTSARDHARLLMALDLPAAAALPGVWSLMLSAPAAALGGVVHAPIFYAVWRVAHRTCKARTDLIARAILPGAHLTLLWYLVVGVLLGVVGGAVLAARGYSPLWAWVAVGILWLALPALGNAAVSWRDAWRARRMVARVQGWSAPVTDELRTTAHALHAAWRSHHTSTTVGIVGTAESGSARPTIAPGASV